MNSRSPDRESIHKKTLKHTPAIERKTLLTKRYVVGLGILTAILSVAIWSVWRSQSISEVDRLLANAYTERRILDLRIPYAKPPVQVERGIVGRSPSEQSEAFLAAYALIFSNLQRDPDNPKWLLAKARAQLLDLQYEPAMQTLQHLLLREPLSPQVAFELAIAYYERGEKNHSRDIDYGKAIEYLSQVLIEKPDDAVALFNRAVIEERLYLYEPALDDWRQFLQMEKVGPWAEEALQRQQQVFKKIESKRARLFKPLLNAEQLSQPGTTMTLNDELQQRTEDYLRQATKEWLPQLFSSSGSNPESLNAALAALAGIAGSKHKDRWLTDLLDGPHGSGFAHAIHALSDAVKANEAGDYARGQASARLASRLFRVAGNQAGELRAIAENVFSDHLLYDGASCMGLVLKLGPRLQRYRYTWLQTQINLEEFNCAGLLGNFEERRVALRDGVKHALDYGYPALYLRGLGFQADTAASLGDTQKGFALASDGLERFWTGEADLMKGYNFYTDLDSAADVLRLTHLQVAVWRQATSLIDLHPDIVLQAMAHHWFGNSAYLADMPELAANEFSKASMLFGKAPPTKATVRGHMDAEIWLAVLETRLGDLERAANRLRQVQDDLKQTPSFAPQINFYNALSEISLRKGDSSASDSSLRSSIFLAEWALNSFRSENSRRLWAKQSQQTYRNLVTWKLHEGDFRGALELWEWYLGAEFRATEHPVARYGNELEIASAPDARNAPRVETPTLVADHLALLHRKTFITYAVLPDGITVWVYDDRDIFWQRIAISPAELETRARQFQRLCSTPDSDRSTLHSISRGLYDALIAPIENRLEAGRTLVFELDGPISAVPVEALMDGDNHYLVERAPIVVSPSLYQVLQANPTGTINPETQALVVSVPIAEGFIPLFDVEKEAQAVARNFHSAHWLKGPDATLTAIRRQLRDSVVFHFAGHAAALPEMNGLVLAEKDPRTQHARLMDAQTFDRETVRGLHLAVLSACDTGLTEEASLSGTEGVAQSLLRNGVPYVVASRWRVDSSKTDKFMEQFYQQLLAGSSVVASLHSAQLALASQPATSHPYYWAAFGIQGS